jgi:hypothetical protein
MSSIAAGLGTSVGMPYAAFRLIMTNSLGAFLLTATMGAVVLTTVCNGSGSTLSRDSGVPDLGGASLAGATSSGGNMAVGGMPASGGLDVGGASLTGGNSDTGGAPATGGVGGQSAAGGTASGGTSGTAISFDCGSETCSPTQYCQPPCCAIRGCVLGSSRCVELPAECNGTASCKCICGYSAAGLNCMIRGISVDCGCQ